MLLARLSLRLCLFAGLSSALFQTVNAHSPRHTDIHVQGGRHRHGAAPTIVQPEVGNSSVQKRGADKKFSWYVAGKGACGGVNGPDDFIVALNTPEWDGGSHCYEMITITYQGKTAEAQIVDQCLECPPGGLDFSHGLFAYFAGNPEEVGIIYGDWSYGTGEPDPTPDPPTTTTHKPHTTTSTPDPAPPTTSTTSTRQHTTSTSSETPSTTSTSTSSLVTPSSTSASSTSNPSQSAEPEGPQLLQLVNQALIQLGGVAVAGLHVVQD